MINMKENILTGEILEGRFRLCGYLGGGNFGTVYKAEELQNGISVREVALKLFSPEVTEKGDIEGMFNDCALPARIMSSSAPLEIKQHFAQIYGWGKINTSLGVCAYVSIELIRNASTFEDLFKRHSSSGHRPNESEVLEKMRQFFTALSEAHKADVKHRDIKGANVMLSNGIVKIVDFGMGARISAGDIALKTTMTIYAPENFGSEYQKAEYTEKSDIYQAGLMFYEYWTGIAIYEKSIHREKDESDEDYNKRAMDFARQMRVDYQYVSGSIAANCVPSDKLDSILSKCLKFSPDMRYQNCEQILKDINSDSISIAFSAFQNGNYNYAEKTALSSLEKAKGSTKADLLILLGDIKAQSENADDKKASKDYYLNAYKYAKEKGVYFLNKPKMRELINKLADSFAVINQYAMEKIYRKELEKFKENL